MNQPPRLNTLNPTGNVHATYDPRSRAEAELGDNMTTIATTANISPNTPITVYRGVPNDAPSTIQAGDYVTTNPQLAKDYAGTGKVITQTVPAADLLDDATEPLAEEYIYRPQPQLGPPTRDQPLTPRIRHSR